MKIYEYRMGKACCWVYVFARNKAEATAKVDAIEKEYCDAFGQPYQAIRAKAVYFLPRQGYLSLIKDCKSCIAHEEKKLNDLDTMLPADSEFGFLSRRSINCIREVTAESLKQSRWHLAFLENPIDAQRGYAQ